MTPKYQALNPAGAYFLGRLPWLLLTVGVILQPAGDRRRPPLRCEAVRPSPDRRNRIAAWYLQYGGEEIRTVLDRDEIAAVFTPKFVPAGRAKIAADAGVIGYAHAGTAHAYALNLLNWHEVVNDDVGGQRIAATW